MDDQPLAKRNLWVGLTFVFAGVAVLITFSAVAGVIMIVAGLAIAAFSIAGYADTTSALRGEKLPPDQRL